ncbi:MAG: chemotaxis protein CheX [Myxococcota bacterium]
MSAAATLRRGPSRHKAHNDAVLDAALCEATIATFAHYDVVLTPVGPSPALRVASHYAVGVIGFSGEGLRGTLVIATCTALVMARCPTGGARPMRPEESARDWIAEVSNLALGRVKIALSRRGVVMGLSTPVAFTGQHIRLGAVQGSRTRAWDFVGAEGSVRAWLEVDFDEDIVLGPELSLDDEDRGLDAGDLVLF